MTIDIQKATQQESRAQILKTLDKLRPQRTTVEIVARSLLGAGLGLKREALQAELAYLAGKQLVSVDDDLYELAPLGVDVLEGSVVAPAGIPQPQAIGPEILVYRHEVRWRIMLALHFAQPMGAPSGLLWRTLDDADLPVSDQELARECRYLEGKGMVAVDGLVTDARWNAKLTPDGIDVADYNAPAPVGVNRPDKYWEG